jgi:hypothetical protein
MIMKRRLATRRKFFSPPWRPQSPARNRGKSLNFQRENSALGLRSTLRREKRVTRGLGFGFHRESSVSRGLTFSNRTEAREGEIQFDFPKRPLTKRQRQRDGDRLGHPIGCWCTKGVNFFAPRFSERIRCGACFTLRVDFPRQDWLVKSLTLLTADGLHRNEKQSNRQQ